MPFNVLVVDNNSTDGSIEMLQQFPWVETLKLSGLKIGERHGKALDAGIAQVRTKYFLVLDSDIEILDHNWLQELLDEILKTDAVFVGDTTPDYKTKIGGNFRERAFPQCLLVNTEFFKENKCTFSPKYDWGGNSIQLDVGADLLSKVKENNKPYAQLSPGVKNRLLHYEGITAGKLFETSEWQDDFELRLKSRNDLNVTQVSGLRAHISKAIEIKNAKVDLINHRIETLLNKPKMTSFPFSSSKKKELIGETIKSLSFNLYNLGEEYFRKKQFQPCIEKFQEAKLYADLDIQCRILARLALVNLRIQSVKEMNKTLNQLNELAPQNSEVCYSIGSIYKEYGDMQNAKKFFEKIIKSANKHSKPFNSGAYFHLGEISLISGRQEEATSHFIQCLKINPEHKKASKYLTEI